MELYVINKVTNKVVDTYNDCISYTPTSIIISAGKGTLGIQIDPTTEYISTELPIQEEKDE